MKYILRDELETIQTRFQESIQRFDTRLVKMRTEMDVHSMYKQIDRKANEEQVRNDFSNHEFKISTLDRNIIRMASDFETF